MRIRHSLLIVALATTALTVTPAAAFASSNVDTGHRGSGLGVTTTQPSLRILSIRSGLKVGTAVNMDLYGSAAKYTRIVNQQFNTVTAENVMKWQLVEPTQGTYDWAAADRLVAGARADHQLVRGHTLVWHNQLPSWLSTDGGATTSFTPQQVRDLLHKHVVDEVTHFRGQIWQWDVVNEAFNDDGTPRQDIFYKAYQALGLDPIGYIADAFRWAHQADPHALLFYNDYNLEFTGAKSNAVYDFVQQLQAQAVPIAGVGFQGHLDTQYGFPDLQNNLQRFAALGLKVALTEVDVRTFVQPDPANPGTYTDIPLTPALQAAQESYWKQTLQACLAVKQCISYTVWGVADSNSWIPGVFAGEGAALLFDDNLNPKPQYQDLRQVLWMTKAPRRA